MCKNTINIEVCAQDYNAKLTLVKRRIIICAGTGCPANGSLKVRDAMLAELAKHSLNANTDLETEEVKQDFLLRFP